MIELQQFDGLNTDEIIARLEDLGYKRFADKPDKAFAAGRKPHGQSVFMFRQPDGDHIVKFSAHRGLTAAFAALCRENADNPFLPHIMADRDVGGGIHMAVIENLKTADELGGVQPGIARAFATLVDRSRADHRDVYTHLLADKRGLPWLPLAVQAIAGKLSATFHESAEPLDYNVRTMKTGPDKNPPSVLFRTAAQHGKEALIDGAQPVYAAPFRPATSGAATLQKRLRHICARAGIAFGP